ncbi:MAG: integrase arm-type DNA-binding domain-containing protein [Methylocella sp.]
MSTTATPSFGIRIGKRRKTWLVVKDQTRTKIRLGHFPSMSLADARKKAMVELGTSGIPREAQTPAFPEARIEYLAQGKWRDNSRKQVTRQLMRFTWTKSLDQITHQDIAHALAQITKPSDAWHAHKDLRAFFNSCVPRYIQSSPINGIKPPSRYIPRQRFLNETEVRAIWQWARLTYDTLLEAKQAINYLETQFRNLKDHLEDAEPESRSLDL